MTDSHGIVVAVDGSPSSDAAVDWAARDAALRHVPLTIVHVQPADEVGPWLDFPVALPQEYLAERDRRSQDIVDDALGVVVDAVSESREFPVHTMVLTGAKMPALIDVSTAADMIVLGRRGVGGLRGLLLGSTSSTLVHHAQCPVAVIHAEADALALPRRPRRFDTQGRRRACAFTQDGSAGLGCRKRVQGGGPKGPPRGGQRAYGRRSGQAQQGADNGDLPGRLQAGPRLALARGCRACL